MSETKFRTMQILLRTNIKDHQTIVYKPKMTVPTTSSSVIYMTPTVRIDMKDIDRLDPKLSAYLSNKLANQRTVSDEDLRYADLQKDNKIDVFLNPKALLDVVQKKIERGNRVGRPVAPKQFKNANDLLNGKLIKLNNRIVFKKDDKYIELHQTRPGPAEFGHGFTIGTVSGSSSFSVGGTITVGNEFPSPDKRHRNLTFTNSVKPLSLQQAHEKGYVNDNIRFITGLLFDQGRKFYYNGNPSIGFPIHSFNVEQHAQEKLWETTSSDPHTLIVTVSLLLLPVLPLAMRKNQLASNNQAMDCIFRKEAIVNNFNSLFGAPGMMHLSSDALVELPKNIRTDSHSGQARPASHPERGHGTHAPMHHRVQYHRPRTYGGRPTRRGRKRTITNRTLKASHA